MTNSHSEINELKTLQVEAAELKDRRKGSNSRITPEASQKLQEEEHVEGQQLSQDDPIEEQTTGADNTVHELAVQIEHLIKDMEEAATERPALALLTVFALGIIVGQLFSRR